MTPVRKQRSKDGENSRNISTRPFEARLSNPNLKRKAAEFAKDVEEKKAEKRARERHAIGAKFFGKHYDPAAEWVKNHPLPSAKVLFNTVGPSSTIHQPLSLSVQQYCSIDTDAHTDVAIQVESSLASSQTQPSLEIKQSPAKSPELPERTKSDSTVSQPPKSSHPPTISKQTPKIGKLTRTQLRKQKIRAKLAANPDLPRLSRRERKSANKVAHELADIFRKHTKNVSLATKE